MKVSKNGYEIYARVVKLTRRATSNFYVLKYITEEKGQYYFIEMPVTMNNRHLKEGDDLNIQLLMGVKDDDI